MTPGRPLQRGDHVLITIDDRQVAGLITLASPNGRSVIVMFDAAIGGWIGAMPAYCDDAGAWTALDGMPVRIALAPNQVAP